jgi:hypothetical protein
MHALPNAPLRHSDTGELCRCENAAATERYFPGVHHRPTHCRPVRARFGPSPIRYVGRKRKRTIQRFDGRVTVSRELLDGTPIR